MHPPKLRSLIDANQQGSGFAAQGVLEEISRGLRELREWAALINAVDVRNSVRPIRVIRAIRG